MDARVYALAGVFQAAALVREAARRGALEQAPFEVSIASTLRLDAGSAAEVYGGPDGVRIGLETLCAQLGPLRAERDIEVTRYAVNLMFLERKLKSHPQMLDRIGAGVQAAAAQAAAIQADSGGVTDPAVIVMLADLYSETLSKLEPRIMVAGEPPLLEDSDNTARIRALLLSGIRAAVLWRQVGGNRLKLLLERSRLVRHAEALLHDERDS